MVCGIFNLCKLTTEISSQDPSFRIVPANAPKSASVTETSNSLGLHDTLRYGPRTIATEVKTEGGLKERLQNVRNSFLIQLDPCRLGSQWEETQDNMKLTMMRNTQGLHAPIRMLMERRIVSAVSGLFINPSNPCSLFLRTRTCQCYPRQTFS